VYVWVFCVFYLWFCCLIVETNCIHAKFLLKKKMLTKRADEGWRSVARSASPPPTGRRHAVFGGSVPAPPPTCDRIRSAWRPVRRNRSRERDAVFFPFRRYPDSAVDRRVRVVDKRDTKAEPTVRYCSVCPTNGVHHHIKPPCCSR